MSNTIEPPEIDGAGLCAELRHEINMLKESEEIGALSQQGLGGLLAFEIALDKAGPYDRAHAATLARLERAEGALRGILALRDGFGYAYKQDRDELFEIASDYFKAMKPQEGQDNGE